MGDLSPTFLVNVANVKMGEPGSPTPPPAGGFGRAQPLRRGIGEPGSPTPPPAEGFGRATPSSGGMGEPGSPTPPPAGGFGRAQPLRGGMGKPAFPIPRRREGVGGHSPPRKEVHPVDVRRSRMDGCGDHRAQGSSPLPASPRWRREPGSSFQRGEGQGGGRRRACGAVARAGHPRSQAMFIVAWCAMHMTVSRAGGRNPGLPGAPSSAAPQAPPAGAVYPRACRARRASAASSQGRV